jgi:hypothetical protein
MSRKIAERSINFFMVSAQCYILSAVVDVVVAEKCCIQRGKSRGYTAITDAIMMRRR